MGLHGQSCGGEPRPGQDFHAGRCQELWSAPASYVVPQVALPPPAMAAKCPRSVKRSAPSTAVEHDLRMGLLRHFHTSRAAFKCLDLDGNGLLSFSEFRRAFDMANMTWASEDIVRHLSRRAKIDAVGCITPDGLDE